MGETPVSAANARKKEPFLERKGSQTNTSCLIFQEILLELAPLLSAVAGLRRARSLHHS
jgi:hypothetical protein